MRKGNNRFNIFIGEIGCKPDAWLTSTDLEKAKDSLELYSFTGDYGLIFDINDNSVVVYEEKN